MKKQKSRWIALAALTLGIGMTSNAHAVWSFANSGSATSFGDSANASFKVDLSAVYATNSNFNTNATTGAKWAAAQLTDQGSSGKGVCSTGDSSGTPCDHPDHAVDNNVNTEGVLLKFSSSVVLSSIGLGWVSDNNSATASDTVDISLFRWTGVGAPTGNPTALIGQNAAAMAGWELVGNYGSMSLDTTANPNYNVVNTGGTGTAGAGGLGSSWWMVSAYNVGYNKTATETRGTGFDTGNDYFKLYAVAGTACTSTTPGVCGGTPPQGGSVPEPGSLALASLALFGVIYTRRKTQATR